MQTDGNLVLYRDDGFAMWTPNTLGSGAVRAVMQNDGDLVVETASGGVVWHSGTAGHPGAYLQLEDDGHLTMWDGSTIVWQPNVFD